MSGGLWNPGPPEAVLKRSQKVAYNSRTRVVTGAESDLASYEAFKTRYGKSRFATMSGTGSPRTPASAIGAGRFFEDDKTPRIRTLTKSVSEEEAEAQEEFFDRRPEASLPIPDARLQDMGWVKMYDPIAPSAGFMNFWYNW